MEEKQGISRRSFLKNTGVIGGAVALGGITNSFLGGSPAYAAASSGPIKIGVVLPFFSRVTSSALPNSLRLFKTL